MNESQLHEQITEVSKTIFSFCLIKTSNRQDAEDLSQDIILELFKSVKNIRDDKAFYGFMWAVAENVYKQWYKKKLKSKTCELTDDIANTLIDFESDDCENFSEYDLEAVAYMIKKGYVLKHDESYKVTMPVLTLDQYNKAVELVSEFINPNLKEVILEMDATATKILSEHTPKHLQSQVAGIASMDKYINAVCIPTKILIERNVLNTNWNSRELPTTFIVLNK